MAWFELEPQNICSRFLLLYHKIKLSLSLSFWSSLLMSHDSRSDIYRSLIFERKGEKEKENTGKEIGEKGDK